MRGWLCLRLEERPGRLYYDGAAGAIVDRRSADAVSAERDDLRLVDQRCSDIDAGRKHLGGVVESCVDVEFRIRERYVLFVLGGGMVAFVGDHAWNVPPVSDAK